MKKNLNVFNDPINFFHNILLFHRIFSTNFENDDENAGSFYYNLIYDTNFSLDFLV